MGFNGTDLVIGLVKKGKSSPETHGFLPSNSEGVPVNFPIIQFYDMDWFKGKITGNTHMKHRKIYGFRLRFSLKPIH